MWNRHRESENTKNFTTSLFRHETYYYLWVKVNSTWGERETQSFYADFSICSTPRAALAANYWSGLDEPRKSTFFFRGRKSTLTFSQIPKSSAHASGPWRQSHPQVTFPLWDFYFDISDGYILSARAWIPALILHQTNPCAKRKVLGLTKPKGKVYKTKSPRNYITH